MCAAHTIKTLGAQAQTSLHKEFDSEERKKTVPHPGLPHQGIEPRVFGLEALTLYHWATVKCCNQQVTGDQGTWPRAVNERRSTAEGCEKWRPQVNQHVITYFSVSGWWTDMRRFILQPNEHGTDNECSSFDLKSHGINLNQLQLSVSTQDGIYAIQTSAPNLATLHFCVQVPVESHYAI